MRFSVSSSIKGALAGAFGLGLVAAPASAATIDIGTTGATLECSVSCEAFSGAGGINEQPNGPPASIDPTGPGVLSDLAHLYNGQPANEADQAARLSTLLDVDVSAVGLGTKYDSPPNVFDSDALYIVLKLGAHTIFVKNTSGGEQEYDYSGAKKLGLSHYTEFGVSEIPLPAAAWLMIAGLAGLRFAGRRRKSA